MSQTGPTTKSTAMCCKQKTKIHCWSSCGPHVVLLCVRFPPLPWDGDQNTRTYLDI